MGKTVLIIDDSEKIRTILKGILSREDYEIVGEGTNGREALELYKEIKPDLVAMDVVMPEVNGIQGLKDIIAYDPEAKVIMITGQDERETFAETIQAGALDHIIKPFEPARVLLAVQQAFEE